MEIKNDTIVSNVIFKLVQRSIIGQQKYGTTLQENNLDLVQWIDHAIEEQMDNILYLEKLKQEVNNGKNI